MNDQLVGDEAACDHVAIRVLGLDDGNNFDRKYCLWIDATIAEFAPLIAICLGDATTCGLCARDDVCKHLHPWHRPGASLLCTTIVSHLTSTFIKRRPIIR